MGSLNLLFQGFPNWFLEIFVNFRILVIRNHLFYTCLSQSMNTKTSIKCSDI